MDRSRGLTRALVLAVVAAALFVAWLALGGFRDSDGEPFPARTNGQTLVPTTTVQPSAPTGSTDPVSGLRWVALAALPPEVADTLAAVESGPPYPYDRDGVTFQNREGLLPDEEYGYYQEFTVTTPGSSDRGARRVIWGLQDEFYYTDDHYESFVRIRP